MADWITTEEASQLTGYSITHLRLLIRQSKLKAEKKGGQYWVDRISLLTYVQEAADADDKRHGAKNKPAT
jgi:excisionase family DNA binding protein